MAELRSLGFLHELSNVVLVGPEGAGKTHLAAGLAHEIDQAGHSVLFASAFEILTDLGRASQEGRLESRMKIYGAPRVLIIDDLDARPFGRLDVTLLYWLVCARFGRGSTIITARRSCSEWGWLLGDQELASALLRRLGVPAVMVAVRKRAPVRTKRGRRRSRR